MRVADIVSAVNAAYPPQLAESWDAVGLVCGDPEAPVTRVFFTVDVVSSTVAQALAAGADLIVAHHPLLLRAVHGVPTTSYKGRLVHTLIKHNVALLTAHTNADAADPGVSDALAAALGVVELRPLRPIAAEPLDKLVTFVPPSAVDTVIDAVNSASCPLDASAGHPGAQNYTRWAWTTAGTGTFVPGPGSHPAVGEAGIAATVTEMRVELITGRRDRGVVLAALHSAHPYEQPAFDVFELGQLPSGRGLGRVGRLAQPCQLDTFLERISVALPATASGIRATGAANRWISTVAVCGGAGDALIADAAAAGADAYLTADLRHHPASECLESGGPALIDVSHWASERPWLDQAAAMLTRVLDPDTVEIVVSDLVTDAWSFTHGR